MIFRFINKFLYVLLVTFLLFLLFDNRILASDPIFEDNFDNNLDKWIIYSGTESNSLVLPEGIFRTYSVNSRNANFLEIKNPLPETNLLIEIRFKFVSRGVQGAGLAINNSPLNGIIFHTPLKDELIFNLWPTENHNVGSTASICLLSDVNCQIEYNRIFDIPELLASDWHIFKIEYIDGIYSFYLDDVYKTSSLTTNRAPRYIWLGNPENTTTEQSAFSELNFDYIRVYEIPAEEENVNDWYYSQKDPLWASDEYDSASVWNSCGDKSIGRWGCAMTDSAMVLKKYKINKSNDTPYTPGELNAWLKNQPDGYLSNGLTNWLAVARLAKEAYESGKSTTALELTRETPTVASIDSIINKDLQPIVNIDGHFVTIYGQEDQDNWKIADPNDITKKTLPKTTPLSSLVYFSPSQTDLSYLMFVTDKNTTLELFDGNNTKIEMIVTNEFIREDSGNRRGEELRIYTLPKPSQSKYSLKASGPYEVYLYDTKGLSKIIKQLNRGNNEYEINYDKNNIATSNITNIDKKPPVVTISSFNKGFITGTASDESGVKKVELAIQPRKWWMFPYNMWLRTWGTNNWMFSVKYFPDGEYRVRARAHDNVGNVSAIVEKIIKIH